MTTTKPQPKAETNRDRFIRLAESRTTKALGAIAQLGELANQQRYEYADYDVGVIITALTDAVARSGQALAERRVPKAAQFKL